MHSESSTARAFVWAFDRWWHGVGAITTATALGFASLILAAWAGHGTMLARATRTGLEAQVATLRVGAPLVPIAAAAPLAADFSADLPATTAPASALEVVQGAAARAAVVVASVQLQELAASPERFGRIELSIQARGGYANLKPWLAEVIERVPASTVLRLQMQRAEGAADIEARFTLVVWSRPLATAALERR
jgi:Type II secretion system (T2SS), protein M subtype b